MLGRKVVHEVITRWLHLSWWSQPTTRGEDRLPRKRRYSNRKGSPREKQLQSNRRHHIPLLSNSRCGSSRRFQRIQHTLHSHPTISPLLVLIISIIAFAIINPRFIQPQTIGIILQQVSVIAALAIGQTLVILTAGIDLSVGAIAILSSLLMANLAAHNGVPEF